MGAPIDSVLCRNFDLQVNVDETGRVIQRRVQPTLESRIEETVKLFNSRHLIVAGPAAAAPIISDDAVTSSAEDDESLNEEASSSVSRRPRAPRSTRSKARPGLRKGKWTVEEEEYALALSHFFKQGILPLNKGKMLRLYLAEQLNCEPMRITKKFTGDECIGKQVFRPCPPGARVEGERKRAMEDLAYLRERFLARTSKSVASKKRALSSPEGPSCSSQRPSLSLPSDGIQKPTLSLMMGGAVGAALTPIHAPMNAESSDSYTMTFTCTPKIVSIGASAAPMETEEGRDVKQEKLAKDSSAEVPAENLLLSFYLAATREREVMAQPPAMKKMRVR